ncbi:MAG: hypothetical protein JWO38_4934 [Gemmataceae bacterium]|nr:hypothetical protein [Gemmataceae bacterium]
MTKLIGCVAAAVTVLAVGLVAWADDEKVPLDKVPAKVKEAVKAKYPKAEILSAELGDQDGMKVYEFEIKEGEKKWEVSFTPEGKFVSAEEPVAAEADLPAKVKEAFRKKYPEAKVVSIEKETSGDGAAAKVVYEIVIEKGKDKVEVQFDPEGKFLGEEKVK